MAYNHEYPYVDPCVYNADWLLNEMKCLKEAWEDYKQTLLDEWEKYKEEQAQLWEDWKNGYITEWNNFKTQLTNQWEAYKTLINNRMDEFETLIQNDIADFETTMNQQFNSFKSEVNETISGFQTNVNQQISNLKAEWSAYQTNITNIVNSVKNLPDEWETYQTAINKEITDITEYVNNYFDRLDVTAELTQIITNKINDGSFNEIIGQGFQKALDKRQNHKVAIVGDSMLLTGTDTVGRAVLAVLRQFYINSVVYEQYDKFYSPLFDSESCYYSLNKIKTKYPNVEITDIVIISLRTPSSYTSDNISLIIKMAQSVYPNATMNIIFAGMYTDQTSLKKYLEFFDRVTLYSACANVVYASPYVTRANCWANYTNGGTPTVNFSFYIARYIVKLILQGLPLTSYLQEEDISLIPNQESEALTDKLHIKIAGDYIDYKFKSNNTFFNSGANISNGGTLFNSTTVPNYLIVDQVFPAFFINYESELTPTVYPCYIRIYTTNIGSYKITGYIEGIHSPIVTGEKNYLHVDCEVPYYPF